MLQLQVTCGIQDQRQRFTVRIWITHIWRWGLLTNPSPTQVMSPRTTSSQRRTSSSIRSPWPSNGSPSNDSSRTSITMMPQSVRCSSKHTENKSITPSEKVCLLTSRRRRQCLIERDNPLLKQWQKVTIELGANRCWNRSRTKPWTRTVQDSFESTEGANPRRLSDGD